MGPEVGQRREPSFRVPREGRSPEKGTPEPYLESKEEDGGKDIFRRGGNQNKVKQTRNGMA